MPRTALAASASPRVSRVASLDMPETWASRSSSKPRPKTDARVSRSRHASVRTSRCLPIASRTPWGRGTSLRSSSGSPPPASSQSRTIWVRKKGFPPVRSSRALATRAETSRPVSASKKAPTSEAARPSSWMALTPGVRAMAPSRRPRAGSRATSASRQVPTTKTRASRMLPTTNSSRRSEA